jgi:hypothetical protein
MLICIDALGWMLDRWTACVLIAIRKLRQWDECGLTIERIGVAMIPRRVCDPQTCDTLDILAHEVLIPPENLPNDHPTDSYERQTVKGTANVSVANICNLWCAICELIVCVVAQYAVWYFHLGLEKIW